MRRTPFIPPSTAGIAQYYDALKTKYYIKAKDLIKAVVLVVIIEIALHMLFS
jgi:hypothetical protein